MSEVKDDIPKEETKKELLKSNASIAGKMSIEPSQNRRIIAEDPEWNLSPVSKLKDLCISVIVKNFESRVRHLKDLPEKYRDTIIESISTEINLAIAATLIPDMSYWKRRSKTRFQLASIVNHGNSWKRLFFELHSRTEIENFVPTTDYEVMEQRLVALKQTLTISAPFVEQLHLRHLKPMEIVPQADDEEIALTNTKTEGTKQSPVNHLNLSIILGILRNLKGLTIYFGYFVIKLEWMIVG